MISTYVAVWAANEEKIETAQHEDYFKNAYEWCKEKALLISIDPVDLEDCRSIDIRVQLMLQHIIQELDSNKSMNSSS